MKHCNVDAILKFGAQSAYFKQFLSTASENNKVLAILKCCLDISKKLNSG